MEEINWHDWFYYDETSPSCLRWKVERRYGRGGGVINVHAHDSAGMLGKEKGYWLVGVKGDVFRGHRVIWEMHNKRIEPDEFIDHIDGNRGNNVLSNLRLVDICANQRNQRKNRLNTSGVTGVYLKQGGRHYGWEAVWRDLHRKKRQKYFSIAQYGNEESFRLACEYRAAMIVELNEQGAGYTHDHGKR